MRETTSNSQDEVWQCECQTLTTCCRTWPRKTSFLSVVNPTALWRHRAEQWFFQTPKDQKSDRQMKWTFLALLVKLSLELKQLAPILWSSIWRRNFRRALWLYASVTSLLLRVGKMHYLLLHSFYYSCVLVLWLPAYFITFDFKPSTL